MHGIVFVPPARSPTRTQHRRTATIHRRCCSPAPQSCKDSMRNAPHAYSQRPTHPRHRGGAIGAGRRRLGVSEGSHRRSIFAPARRPSRVRIERKGRPAVRMPGGSEARDRLHSWWERAVHSEFERAAHRGRPSAGRLEVLEPRAAALSLIDLWASRTRVRKGRRWAWRLPRIMRHLLRGFRHGAGIVAGRRAAGVPFATAERSRRPRGDSWLPTFSARPLTGRCSAPRPDC